MSFLLAALLGLLLGIGSKTGYDQATSDELCTDSFASLQQEMLDSGLQYVGSQQFTDGEVFAWADNATGEVYIWGFLQTPAATLSAQSAGFNGMGSCVTPGGAEIYIVHKLIQPPKNEVGTSTHDGDSAKK